MVQELHCIQAVKQHRKHTKAQQAQPADVKSESQPTRGRRSSVLRRSRTNSDDLLGNTLTSIRKNSSLSSGLVSLNSHNQVNRSKPSLQPKFRAFRTDFTGNNRTKGLNLSQPGTNTDPLSGLLREEASHGLTSVLTRNNEEASEVAADPNKWPSISNRSSGSSLSSLSSLKGLPKLR